MAGASHETVADKRLLAPSKSEIGLLRPDSYTGIRDWLTTVDHKKLGIMYAACALFFFLVGGIEALMIRLQLMYPGGHVVTAQAYNQLFTMHGTTMVFLAVMPLNAAFFNYLMPLQIGARDVAFPRLNAFGLWTFVAGALVLNFSWIFQWAQTMGWFSLASGQTDIAPAIGWFGYAPLTAREFSGIGTDFWILGLSILGISSLAGSFNFIVTIINMRAPGMTMMRLPVFTWMTLITSFLIIFAFPAITIALIELMFDRFFGTNFYQVDMGGQPILWQHLFWIFGHPEVYILILPTMGIVSEILPTFARKPLFGYPMVVFSGAVIGFLGFAVWSHHMFTTGLGKVATAAFSLLPMAIAVPTGVKILNWLGTLWGGRIRFSVSMVFALGFIWMFMMGGLSGLMHAAAPADAQQQDSYFIVAHFHYVLIGGALLALLGGLYFWVPKMSGRMMSEKLGYFAAGMILVGFNLAFFPMHYLGLTGMPRRTHTYLSGFGWETWNFYSTIGAFILGIGVCIVVLDIIRTIFSGKPCGGDPWDARTLEWSTPSPVPAYNFARTPIIPGRDPWWMHKHGKKPEQQMEYDIADADGFHMPSQSWWPLFASLGLFIVGVSAALYSGGLPYSGVVALFGLGLTIVSIFLWALEGPGGYYLKPPSEDDPGVAAPVAPTLKCSEFQSTHSE
mgnify:CR=1 FL=1